MSRDGGLTWRSLRGGVYSYEIGDHGAIIVIAKKNTPTDYIEYSWDEGETWDRIKISDRMLMVDDILIEPDNISQQFIIHGTYAEDGLEDDEAAELFASDR